jgi:hypothetical protein
MKGPHTYLSDASAVGHAAYNIRIYLSIYPLSVCLSVCLSLPPSPTLSLSLSLSLSHSVHYGVPVGHATGTRWHCTEGTQPTIFGELVRSASHTQSVPP